MTRHYPVCRDTKNCRNDLVKIHKRARTVGQITPPQKVKPIFGLLYKTQGEFQSIKERIESHFSPIDYTSEEFAFTETHYYEKEMGADLIRRYVSTQELIYPDRLPHYKNLTNLWEDKTRQEGNRAINIDPGYLTPAKLVLASTKDFSQRIYLGKGIYAEITMTYARGDFIQLPWTYPDYYNHRDVFQEIRAILIEQIRNQPRD
ncbi:DUF4416 family protein [bacterium]|nr:DUF4416 family protein [bacterium]